MAVDMGRASYKLWLFRGSLAIITLTAFLSIPSYYFPHTAMGKGWPLKFESIGVFIPQEWAFFTKDPREETRLFFLEEKGSWKQLAPYRFSADNQWGFNRHMRAQIVWFSQILKSLDAFETFDCNRGESAESCLTRIGVTRTAQAPLGASESCDAVVGYVSLKPIAWEWKRRNPQLEPKLRAAKVKVTCN